MSRKYPVSEANTAIPVPEPSERLHWNAASAKSALRRQEGKRLSVSEKDGAAGCFRSRIGADRNAVELSGAVEIKDNECLVHVRSYP